MTEPTESDLSPKQSRFLEALRAVGTIRKAAALADIARASVDRWRRDDLNGFRGRFHEALDDFADGLEAKMFDLIGEMKVGHNPTLLIFALKAARPLKYRELTQIPDENARDLLRKLEELTAAGRPGGPSAAPPALGPGLTPMEQVEQILRANSGGG